MTNEKRACDLAMLKLLLPIEWSAEISHLSRTCPQRCLPDGIPRERGSFVLREDGFSGRKSEKHNPAAAVFEETAGATLELAHLEPLVGSRF